MPPVSVGKEPFGIAINPQGTRVYAANNGHGFGDNTVSVIDVTADRNIVIDTINVGSAPGGLTVNPAGSRLYVVNNPASTLSVVDITSDADTVTATVPLNGSNGASGIVVTPSGTRAYIAGPDARLVHVFNIVSNSVVAEISVGGRPQGVALNPSGDRLYVTDSGGNSVFVIDTTANPNIVLGTVTVGTSPFGIAVEPTGTRVYVAGGPNVVSVIDATTNTVVKTVTVGNDPVAFGQFIAPASFSLFTPPPRGTGNDPGAACVFTSEPINTGNGDYFYQHADFVIPGRGVPLVFQRSYNTLDNYAGPLGTNWTHSYNILLERTASGVIIKWGDGHGETFTVDHYCVYTL